MSRKIKFLITLTFLLMLIVIVNMPKELLSFSVNIQPQAATITLSVIILIVSYLYTKNDNLLMHVEGPVIQEKKTDTHQNSLISKIKESKSLMEMMDKLKAIIGDDESFANIDNESKIYWQSYMWVSRMEELYGKDWREVFQAAQMPVKQEDFGKMRSLITEIALHTVDFCRYRTGYVNLSEEMKVNPRMILLNKSIKEAGGLAINTNPYDTNREVRVLSQLMDNDGVTIKNAAIHGYYKEENN